MRGLTTGRPGRPPGTSPERYSYDEMRVIFNLLLENEPVNPTGGEILKQLHAVSTYLLHCGNVNMEC